MSALAVSHVYPLGSRLNERGRLEVGGCDVVELAAEFGTPAYVYAEDDMRARARSFVEAFRARTERFEVIYASKAFPCTAVYRLFADEGLSADVASGGELHLALAAGMDPKRLYMHGNNKSPAELDYAIDSGIGHIVVDSFDEIERLRGRSQRVMVRVTPGIEPSTHSYIQTGQVDSKFGFPMAEVPHALEACTAAGLEVRGLHAHIGSQITDLDPLARAARALVELSRELAGEGTRIEHLDLGGGLGVSYDGSRVPTAQEYADAVLPIVRESGLAIVLEPGRQIVAPAGALLTRVVDVKDAGGDKLFVIMDAGMTELIRPMLYNAFHRIEPVVQTGAPLTSCDVVGPLCESSDTLGKDRMLPRPQVGELYAVLDTGAYGSVMASNYNRRLLPAEVMVEDGKARLIRRRQTIDELLALEI